MELATWVPVRVMCADDLLVAGAQTVAMTPALAALACSGRNRA
jgi:hypothetical protein